MKSTITLILSVLFLAFNHSMQAQNNSLLSLDEECAFTLKQEKLMEAHPELRQMLRDYKTRILPAVSRDYASSRSQVAPVIRIPVVVHIIHNAGENPGEGQNLSDAQVEAQIEVLNEDFSATNPNFGDTPARWESVVGNPEIQFCLAAIDPNGNPTTGITRHVMQVTVDMSGNDNIESEIKPATNWDPNIYYNIYTLPIPGTTAGGGTTGYAYLPSPFTIGNGSTDGTVVDYRWFGGPGFSQSGYKTLTHETGHYLGLYHPFGSNSCDAGDMDCAEDDGLDDTPNVDRPTNCFPGFSCSSSFPTGPMSCGNEHMYINYMDYSSSSCKTSFTNDQIAIMRSVLDGTMNQYNWGSRLPLANNALAVCTFNTNDASVAEIQNPGTFQCDTMMIIPQVKITNFGITPLTTVTISYQLNNNTPVSMVWIDNLPSGGSSVVALPSFTPPAGLFEFKCYVSMPNGMPDENTANDTLSIQSVTVITQDLPLMEDFDDAQFDPTINGVFSFNPNQDAYVWEHNTLFSSFGNPGGCAEFDNFTTIPGQNPTGKIDGLLTQVYDFSTVEDAVLYFDLAYAPYNGTFFDSLIIVASIDCGRTFNQLLYRDGNVGMATAPATTSIFVPQANQWRTEQISLSAFNNVDNITFAFFNLSGFGNKLYLDNINVLPACFLTVDDNITDVSCFGVCEGSATVVPSGGTEPYTFQWDSNAGNQTTAIATDLCAGDYEVTITDATSCTRVYQVSITEPDPLGVSVLATNPTAANVDDGTVTATPLGGNPACYDYLWSNSETSQDISNLPPGNYSVTVTDCNGCTATIAIDVEPFDCSAFTADFQTIDVNCNGENTGEILLNPIGGTAPLVYNWTPTAATGNNPTDLAAGDYAFTITDASGCTFTDMATITEPPVLNVGVTTTDLTSVGADDGTATASGSGGTPPYTYDWGAFGTGPMISNLPAGIYEVTITDDKGCTTVNEGEVNSIDCSNFVVSDVSSTAVSCFGDVNGSATVFTTGGADPIEYLWDDVDNQTTQTASGLAPGVYTVVVTDANACTKNAEVEVTSPDVLAIQFVEINNPTCNGAADGSILVEVTGGQFGFIFDWDNIAGGSDNPTDLPAGTYCVTVTDANACSITDCITLTEPEVLVFTHSGETALNCFGDLSGNIDFMASGGNSGTAYSYEWLPDVWGGTMPFLENLPAGMYSGTVTDGMGCTATTSFEITQPSEFSVSASATAETAAGANDGTVSAAASGGVPSYTYDWGAAGTGPALDNLSPGVYVVTATDTNGCTSEAFVIVAAGNVDCSSFEVTLSATPVSCFGDSDGTATAMANGGLEPYTYDWSNGDTGSIADNLPAGPVSITITDANNCILIEDITITQPDPITLDFTIVNESANGAEDGSISAMASGGTGGYTYSWFNSDAGSLMGALITDLFAGFYDVTVTDANGCTFTPGVPVEVEVNLVDCNTLTASAQTTSVSCFGFEDGTATAIANGGTPPYLYNWGIYGTGPMVSGLPAGLILFTVTDGNGCVFEGEVEVNEPNELFVNAIATNETSAGANDGSIAIGTGGGTSPYLYDWADLPGMDDPSDRDNLAAGVYNLTVTDANGCSKIITVTVETGSIDCSNFDGTISSTNITCFGLEDGTATAMGNGGEAPYTYVWSSATTGPTATDLPIGLVLVTITDSRGCKIVLETFIEQPDPLTIMTGFTYETTAGANDGTASAMANGGTPPYSYDWGSAGVGSMVSNLAPGIYTVVLTDANGCIEDASVTIGTGMIDCSGLNIFISTLPLTCSNSGDGIAAAVVVGGTVPYTYDWSDGTTGVTTNQLPGGLVGVTVTDSRGCVITDEAIVNAPLPITVNMTITDESIAGFNDGAVTAMASGGTPPYTYDWGALGMNPTIDQLAPGTYVVEVVDSKGCQTIATALVESGMVCTITASFVVGNVSCNGLQDGSVTATASGGVAIYTYTWSNGDSGPTADNLPTGIVTLTITDADNCILIREIPITEPDVLEVMTTSTDETVLGNNDGTATATATGGTPPYNYDWGSAGTGSTRNNLAPGTYLVLVTDANGCQTEAEVIINPGQPDCSNFDLSFDVISVQCFGGNDGIATVLADGGIAPYQYTWSNGATSGTINDKAGTYSVLVRDAVGCELEKEVTIDEPAALELQVVGLDGECGSNATVMTVVNGGTDPYTYQWNTGDTDATLTNRNPGTYSVTVTDANGCSKSGSASVTVEDSGIATEVERQNVSCFGESDGSIQLNIVKGVAPFEVEWNNGATGTSLDGLSAGSYTVQISDAIGCVYLRTIVIESPAALSVSVNVVSSDPGQNGGRATAIVQGGIAPYTYLWSTGASGPILNNLAIGNYSVTVTDVNGCTAETTFGIFTTGIADLSDLTEWNLSPNPSTGRYFVHAVFVQSEDLEVSIFNLLGQQIFHKTGQGQTLDLSIDLTDQPAGTYFLRLKTTQGQLIEPMVLTR